MLRASGQIEDHNDWRQIHDDLGVKNRRGPDAEETFPLCRSSSRIDKERAMRKRFEARIEQGLRRQSGITLSLHRSSATKHVSKRAVLHLVFAMLLLLGQHGVLTHSAWHLGDHVHAEGSRAAPRVDSKSPAPNKGSLQATLCDLHMVMGSLLAGDCTAASAPFAAAPAQAIALVFAVDLVARASTTPPARAPPAFL